MPNKAIIVVEDNEVKEAFGATDEDVNDKFIKACITYAGFSANKDAIDLEEGKFISKSGLTTVQIVNLYNRRDAGIHDQRLLD